MIINKTRCFQRIFAIFKKELIQLKRDRLTFIIIVFLPIIQLVLFGYAINNDPKFISTAVISHDNSIIARDFIVSLKNSEYFSVNYNITSEAYGQQLLTQGKVLFLISIPSDFNRNLIRGLKPKILVEADASDPAAITGALATMNQILTAVIDRDLATGSLAYLRPTDAPFEVLIHKLYNPGGKTSYSITHIK